MFLGVGIISLILPWSFILTWTGRIVVYGLFGPQMKIVDLWLRANKSDEFLKVMATFDQKKKAARLRREQALKVKAVKCLRFGQFITQVPAYNLARHFDRPLPASTARLARKAPKIECNSYIPGQQLYGEMIPRLENGYHSNQTLALARMESLSGLQTRLVVLRAAAKLGGGVKRRRKLMLKAQPSDEELPKEAGYELVETTGRSLSQLMLPTETKWTARCLEGCDIKHIKLPLLAGMSLCIVPHCSSDSHSFEEKRMEHGDVISIPTVSYDNMTEGVSARTTYDGGTSPQSTFDDATDCFPRTSFDDTSQESSNDEMSQIYNAADGVPNAEPPMSIDMSTNEQDQSVHNSDVFVNTYKTLEDEVEDTEDEGIEIIAWGRFQTKDDNEGCEIETSGLTGEAMNSLSILHRASNSTFVAFYRP